MWREFKQFISRGNVFDLAIAVMIGAAFGKIVESLVQDIMIPIVGIVFGGINFEGLTLKVKAEVIEIGKFIQTTVDFLLVAASIFFMIKLFNRLRGGEEQYKVKQTTNLEVLQEIRDLLKEERSEPIQLNGPSQQSPSKSGLKIHIKNKRNVK
ncbi:large conductance mechanosensitive channel protein MscL [Rossellomorea sp. NS-SX7]|uniref:large conductance mechanosensitive channel protein MscL n=1 Tax=Rossellomorea sp. NS-SX7 TaxID=3463856 RepID=UPI0040595FC6